MKKRLGLLVLVLLLGIMLFSSCQKRPDKDIADAETSLEAAKDAGAPAYAKQEFKSAEDMMAKTYKLVDDKNYKEAKEAALTTKELAEVAKAKALQRKKEGIQDNSGNSSNSKLSGSGNGEAGTIDEGAVTGEQLKEEIAESKVGTGSLGEGVTIDKLNIIHFDFDSYSIDPSEQEVLKSHAEWLKKHPTVKIRIEGHTDERGTEEYNMALGENRAKAAKDYLVLLGISADRMEVVSFGEENPINPGHGEDAWAENRRDEFVIVNND